VLRGVSDAWQSGDRSVQHNMAALRRALTTMSEAQTGDLPAPVHLDAVASALLRLNDPENGGLKGAPKFPNPPIFRFLWQNAFRTGQEAGHEALHLMLRRMSQGGIYDHLGGGFSRYSVDERWLTPHFEKMLYDNAQLLGLLALAYGRSGNPLYRQRAAETVGWLAREMTTPEGAFSASLDADSEGEEGKFYVWSKTEIVDALGAENAAFFVQHYDVTEQGNFEGHNILNRLNTLPRSAEDESRLGMLRDKLLMLRSKRVRPGLDDKVLADWNGLMIAALANAGTMLGEPSWIEMAARAFAFIVRSMTKDDRLGHSWRDGRLLYPGLASDFANMIRAALSLHEATGQEGYLEQALAWQRAFDASYANPGNGAYYLTASDAEGLVVRPAATTDDATPNPNSIAAQNLIRLAALTGDMAWREQADRLFDGVLAGAADSLLQHAELLNALDLRLHAAEIVVTGPDHERFAAVALRLPYLSRIVLRAANAAALPAGHPAQAKIAASAGSAAFVCVGETCSLPVTDPDRIAEVVGAMRPGAV
jgi:hypothetical protein